MPITRHGCSVARARASRVRPRRWAYLSPCRVRAWASSGSSRNSNGRRMGYTILTKVFVGAPMVSEAAAAVEPAPSVRPLYQTAICVCTNIPSGCRNGLLALLRITVRSRPNHAGIEMYVYDRHDQTLIEERVAQFRDQTRRFLAGELSEEEFRPLRLMNGLYIQRHAPMLRIAIPYGLLSAQQLRKLAAIARRYDKGYGHFTTRQNLQLNWPRLEDVPEILAELASVQMHAI